MSPTEKRTGLDRFATGFWCNRAIFCLFPFSRHFKLRSNTNDPSQRSHHHHCALLTPSSTCDTTNVPFSLPPSPSSQHVTLFQSLVGRHRTSRRTFFFSTFSPTDFYSQIDYNYTDVTTTTITITTPQHNHHDNHNHHGFTITTPPPFTANDGPPPPPLAGKRDRTARATPPHSIATISTRQHASTTTTNSRTNDKRQTMNDERQTTNDERQTTNDKR